MTNKQNNTVYRAGVSTEPKCKASWCNLEACFLKAFCRYHWRKLTPLARSVINMSYRAVKRGRGHENLENNLAAAVDYLIKGHLNLIPCRRCKGKGYNTGHTAYLSNNHPCQHCNEDGLVPEIY